MDGITLTFNGFPFASKLSTYNVDYEINYRKIVTALDGTEYFANGTRRPIVTFSLFPMTGEQAKAYYDALKNMAGTCIYTDPATDETHSAQMRVVSNLSYVFGHKGIDDNLYYRGGQITLRGVECLA